MTHRYAGHFTRGLDGRRFKSPKSVIEEDPLVNTVNPRKPKKQKEPDPPPTAKDPDVEAARQEELRRRRKRRGFGSTILTSPLGDSSPANIQRRTLLGG